MNVRPDDAPTLARELMALGWALLLAGGSLLALYAGLVWLASAAHGWRLSW